MYIFLSFDDDGSVWSEVQKLLPSDGAGQDTFGSSVSVYAGILAVGSSLHDSEHGIDSGYICIHEEYLHIANA